MLVKSIFCECRSQNQSAHSPREISIFCVLEEMMPNPTPTWEALACYMIDNCEGETITEESIQRWASKMLLNSRYNTVVDPLIMRDVRLHDAAVAESITETGKALVRELDVLVNGEHACETHTLLDIVGKLRAETHELHRVYAVNIHGSADKEHRYYLNRVQQFSNGDVIAHVPDGNWAFVYEAATRTLKYCDYKWVAKNDWEEGEWEPNTHTPISKMQATLLWCVDIPAEHWSAEDSFAALEYACMRIPDSLTDEQRNFPPAGVTVFHYPTKE